MSPIISRIKSDVLGYVTLAAILGIVIGTHLLSLCVFLLFIHLITDAFTSFVLKRFPRASKMGLLITLYVILALITVAICYKVLPFFLADFSKYYISIERDVTRLLDAASRRWGIEIDIGFLKQGLFQEGSKSLEHVFSAFNGALKGLVYIVFAIVLNFLVMAERERISKVFNRHAGSLLSYQFHFMVKRISRFYRHFRTVMGGQVIISLINTGITFVVMVVLGLPHKTSLTAIVFVCGLLPVVGNLVSNTILTITAMITLGPVAALVCLILLVVIHKLEYFLNSKIIGTIVHLPMFVTLLALLFGEAVLGIVGMILAVPFVLTLKDELEEITGQPGTPPDRMQGADI
jgi:predicted PurR-regulated permease PerM